MKLLGTIFHIHILNEVLETDASEILDVVEQGVADICKCVCIAWPLCCILACKFSASMCVPQQQQAQGKQVVSRAICRLAWRFRKSFQPTPEAHGKQKACAQLFFRAHSPKSWKLGKAPVAPSPSLAVKGLSKPRELKGSMSATSSASTSGTKTVKCGVCTCALLLQQIKLLRLLSTMIQA